jgi:hypothetical protein
MTKKIITISRQYGSGGREIGEKVAALLGYSYYDEELIKRALPGFLPISVPGTSQGGRFEVKRPMTGLSKPGRVRPLVKNQQDDGKH